MYKQCMQFDCLRTLHMFLPNNQHTSLWQSMCKSHSNIDQQCKRLCNRCRQFVKCLVGKSLLRMWYRTFVNQMTVHMFHQHIHCIQVLLLKCTTHSNTAQHCNSMCMRCKGLHQFQIYNCQRRKSHMLA